LRAACARFTVSFEVGLTAAACVARAGVAAALSSACAASAEAVCGDDVRAEPRREVLRPAARPDAVCVVAPAEAVDAPRLRVALPRTGAFGLGAVTGAQEAPRSVER